MAIIAIGTRASVRLPVNGRVVAVGVSLAGGVITGRLGAATGGFGLCVGTTTTTLLFVGLGKTTGGLTLADALGETLAEGLTEALGLTEGLALTLADGDALGETDTDGDGDGLVTTALQPFARIAAPPPPRFNPG